MIESVFFALSIVTLFYIYLNTGDTPCIQYKKNGRIFLNTIREEHQLSDISFKTWLETLTVHSVEDNEVTIVVPTADWYQLYY